jgi:hypothetical protein
MSKQIEEVSAIMALGRVVHQASSYGPPAPDEFLVEEIQNYIFEIEDEYWECGDINALKDDLWHLRCLCQAYSDYIRDTSKTRYAILPKCPPSCRIAKGADIEGDYEMAYLPFLDEFVWSWGTRRSLVSDNPGRWIDLHDGYTPVAVDITPIEEWFAARSKLPPLEDWKDL